MKLPVIRGALSVLFCPSYAKEISRRHHEYLNSPQRRTEKGQTGQEREAYANSWPERQVDVLRHGWLWSILLMAAMIVSGWIAGFVLATSGPDWDTLGAILQYVGAAALLLGTLASQGWPFESLDGATFIEKVSLAAFRFVHCAGTLFVVAGTAWSQYHIIA
jgi:hypothetical protein